MTKAQKAVEKARAALERAEAALRDERRRRRILCSCGKRHPIGGLELIVTHWYSEPSGCSEGDFWSEGEWRFVCPTSKVENRLVFDDYNVAYAMRRTAGVAAEPTFKRIYRDLFATSSHRHGNHYAGQVCNNFYADQNRERFELPKRPERVRD